MKAAALLLISSVLSSLRYQYHSDPEQARAAWGQMQNQYPAACRLDPQPGGSGQGLPARQAGLSPPAVIERQAKATSIQVDASTLDNPEKLKQFQQAQDGLSSALTA